MRIDPYAGCLRSVVFDVQTRSAPCSTAATRRWRSLGSKSSTPTTCWSRSRVSRSVRRRPVSSYTTWPTGLRSIKTRSMRFLPIETRGEFVVDAVGSNECTADDGRVEENAVVNSAASHRRVCTREEPRRFPHRSAAARAGARATCAASPLGWRAARVTIGTGRWGSCTSRPAALRPRSCRCESICRPPAA
jgi:hypothetical protein